jgi:hypothetical protein
MEDVLSKEVFDEARNIELKHIQMEVINRSTPTIYQRRTTGGIDDPNNIVGFVKNMTLTVDNVTQFNNGYGTYNHGDGLPQLINDGSRSDGFYYDFPGEHNLSRPFVDYAVDEIEKSDRIDKTFQRAMRKRGYDVK